MNAHLIPCVNCAETRMKVNFVLTVLLVGLGAIVAQPALAVVISFEQGEGFPAPELIPDPAPGGVVDPNYNFTGFAGGANTGYPGAPGGPIPDKPALSTNGGVVVNWGVLNQARTHGTWFIDDGPGGLDILSGGVPTCVGDPNSCDPAPVSGSAMAGFGIGNLGGLDIAYEGVIDFDNSANVSLESFYYANRGNGPPRLQVEYYSNDVSETFLGVNTYAKGTVGNSWVGVGPSFEPRFQLITPTEPFQNVPLGKVVIRSFQDGCVLGTGTPACTTPQGNGDFPSDNHQGHGTFFLDDITLGTATSIYNPNNYTRISFEASEGLPDTDGAAFENTSIPGVVTNFGIAGPIFHLQIDHGPGGEGSGDEPDPIHGSQMAHSRSGANGPHEITIDLDNSGAYGLVGFHYANRGSFPPNLKVKYYDLNENFIGENSYLEGVDGGVGVGLASDFNPKFQEITPSAAFQNIALSKIVLVSEKYNDPTGSATFSIDDVLLQPNSGDFNPNNYVRVSFETSEGFPDQDGGVIDGTAFPAGIVDNWGISGPIFNLQIDHGPGGDAGTGGFGDEPDPVHGSQIALSRPGANGAHEVTMDLNNSANLTLEGFYYANRGAFPPQLTVEYFDPNEISLGTDIFTDGVAGTPGVGLGADFFPQFQLIEPSAQFQNVALSKLVFTSEGPTSGSSGAFMLDEILFSVMSNENADFDNNGFVDGLDFLILQQGLGVGTTQAEGDANGDNVVNAADLAIWESQYGASPLQAASTTVPEPSSVALVFVAMLAVAPLAKRRRKA